MESPESIRAFLSPLAALQRLISRFDDRGVVIGGMAASLLGKPRLTADLDALLLVSSEEISQILTAAQEEGIVSRVPRAEDFARKQKVLLMRHEESGVNIDLILGGLPFESELVERSQVQPIAGILVRLPLPEDLIIMKAVAHRPTDLQDIRGLIDSHSNLDKARIKHWITQFADALEMPELWEDIKGWL